MTRQRLPVLRPIAAGYRHTFRNLGATLVLVALVQGAVALVAAPLLVGAVGVAARASGMQAVTTATAGRFLTSPLGVAITVLALVLLVVAIVAQAAVFAEVAHDRTGAPASRRASLREPARRAAARVTALVRRPSTALLVPYLVLVLPLGQLGIGSVLTRWVAVPDFVSDELLKSPGTAAAYVGVLLIVLWLNVRLVFTIPILALDDVSVPAALRRSWQATRWGTLRVLGLIVGVVVPMGVALGLLAGLAMLPTLASDALTPGASTAVASISLGMLQVAVFFTVGVFLMVQTQTFVTALRGIEAVPPAPDAPGVGVQAPGRRRMPRLGVIVVVGALVAVGAASAAVAGPLDEAADGHTLILAHRGFVAGGVENTISSLEAANAAGADLVEMDVQQTKDGGWVVLHDADLTRLAGRSVSIGQLTLAEATAITVHDEEGHTDRIPSLQDYLRRADELGQALLIEIKLHGGESPDFVRELLTQIDVIDDASEHIYHTLSADVVDRVKALRPDLTIGYIVPVAYGGVPDTPADFLVVEQGVYTRELRDAVWDRGRALFVWTVQDPARMRELFRDGVDGIITDHPDLAVHELDEVAGEQGMAGRLADAADRLIAAG